MCVFFNFLGHGWPATPWLRLNVSHPIRRRVAVTTATEVRLVVVVACPTHVGVGFPIYGYALKQSAAIPENQAQPIKLWFRFAQGSEENHTNLLFDSC